MRTRSNSIVRLDWYHSLVTRTVLDFQVHCNWSDLNWHGIVWKSISTLQNVSVEHYFDVCSICLLQTLSYWNLCLQILLIHDHWRDFNLLISIVLWIDICNFVTGPTRPILMFLPPLVRKVIFFYQICVFFNLNIEYIAVN